MVAPSLIPLKTDRRDGIDLAKLHHSDRDRAMAPRFGAWPQAIEQGEQARTVVCRYAVLARRLRQER